MKPLGREVAAAALLAALVSGCSNLHVPFRQLPAPALQPGQSSLEAQIRKQHQPQPSFPPPLTEAELPVFPPYRARKARRGRRSQREERNIASSAPSNQPTTPPAATVIGQLTAGDSATESKTKRDTEGLISETEQGLGAIKRQLSRDEQTTASEIRTFLAQAKQALANGDVEGAKNLATKAKLELDELTKQ